jgi:hypothetical protein
VVPLLQRVAFSVHQPWVKGFIEDPFVWTSSRALTIDGAPKSR